MRRGREPVHMLESNVDNPDRAHGNPFVSLREFAKEHSILIYVIFHATSTVFFTF